MVQNQLFARDIPELGYSPGIYRNLVIRLG